MNVVGLYSGVGNGVVEVAAEVDSLSEVRDLATLPKCPSLVQLKENRC